MRTIAFALIASSLAACQSATPLQPIGYRSPAEQMQFEITARDLKTAIRVCGGDEGCVLNQQDAHARLQSVWNSTYNDVYVGNHRNRINITPTEVAQRDLKIRTLYGASVGKATRSNGDIDWVGAERNLLDAFQQHNIDYRVCLGRVGFYAYTFQCPDLTVTWASAEPPSNAPQGSPSAHMKIAKPFGLSENQK